MKQLKMEEKNARANRNMMRQMAYQSSLDRFMMMQMFASKTNMNESNNQLQPPDPPEMSQSPPESQNF